MEGLTIEAIGEITDKQLLKQGDLIEQMIDKAKEEFCKDIENMDIKKFFKRFLVTVLYAGALNRDLRNKPWDINDRDKLKKLKEIDKIIGEWSWWIAGRVEKENRDEDEMREIAAMDKVLVKRFRNRMKEDGREDADEWGNLVETTFKNRRG